MAYCQVNKLNQTAKWLGELLVSVDVPQKKLMFNQRKAANGATRQGNNVISTDDQVMSSAADAVERYSDTLDEQDLTSPNFDKVFFERPSQLNDTLNLARTLFELREYRKCAYMLDKIKDQSQSALFLRNFATYMICEQMSEE